MSTPNSSWKRSKTPMASSEKRISVSVGNCERMPPAALLVVPLPTASRSGADRRLRGPTDARSCLARPVRFDDEHLRRREPAAEGPGAEADQGSPHHHPDGGARTRRRPPQRVTRRRLSPLRQLITRQDLDGVVVQVHDSDSRPSAAGRDERDRTGDACRRSTTSYPPRPNVRSTTSSTAATTGGRSKG